MATEETHEETHGESAESITPETPRGAVAPTPLSRTRDAPAGHQPNGPGTLSRETILGLDNVPLELPIAGLGSRVLGGVIDYFLLTILGVLLLTGGIFLIVNFQDLAWWLVGGLLLALVGLHWTYFAGFELALDGRTPGKMAVGVQVVSRDGGAPSKGSIILRTLVRDLDVMVGVLVIAVDPLSRRLGDRLGGTLVVHTSPADEEVVLARLPRGWGAEDGAVLESLLDRAGDLGERRTEDLAHRLRAAVHAADPGFLPQAHPGESSLNHLIRGFYEAPQEG